MVCSITVIIHPMTKTTAILIPINWLATWAIRLLVAMYRGLLSPVMGGTCRYHPTCSQYMLDAVDKHGPWRGTWRGLKRIARCHPWGGMGHDPA